MTQRIIEPYFLLVILLAAFALVATIFAPFFSPLLIAALTATVLTPVYRFAVRTLGGRETPAAFLVALLSLACIVFPLFLLSLGVVREAYDLYMSLAGGAGFGFFDTIVKKVEILITTYVPGTQEIFANFSADLDAYVQQGLGVVVTSLGSLAAGLTGLFLSIFIFFVALVYFLRDGASFVRTLVRLSPLSDRDDEYVVERLERAVNTVIRGSLTVALIQGIIGSIGLAIFGVPHPLLWGMATSMAALVPGVGTSLVMIPSVIYLAFNSGPFYALGLLVWALVAVGLVDNMLGPHLVGKNLELHPLLVLLSVLGGLSFFGPLGVFLGPLSVSLLGALLTLYKAVPEKTA